MSKSFKLTLAAGFLSASALLAAPSAFAQTAFPGGDTAEATAVQTAIDHDAGLRLSHITVQTIDGVVYLQGRTDDVSSVERAEEIARGVPNVGKIVNAIGDTDFQG